MRVLMRMKKEKIEGEIDRESERDRGLRREREKKK